MNAGAYKPLIELLSGEAILYSWWRLCYLCRQCFSNEIDSVYYLHPDGKHWDGLMCVYVNLSVYAHASTQIGCRWNTGISDGSKEDKWGCSTTAISWRSTFKSFNCCRRCVLGHWTRLFRSKRSKVWTVRSHDSLFVKKKSGQLEKDCEREKG